MRALCGLSLLLLSACDPFHVEIGPGDVQHRQAAELSAAPMPREGLRVMNWNIKFAGAREDFFWDCYGDRVLMKKREVDAHLEALAEAIVKLNPDVLFVQELDLNSRRTAHIDQLKWLLDHTALNHGVYASQWRADFVPSDGLGAVDNGNAILARWPLTGAVRHGLPLRGDQSGIERYFYLRRNVLEAHLQLPEGAPIALANVHTAAYSQDGTKGVHIERFKEILDGFDDDGLRFVAGGDLNTLPPGSEQRSGFDDSVCDDPDYIGDDYSEESEYLSPFYADYAAAVDLEVYQADNARYFSHTVDGRGFWNRKLDYLFTNGAWVAGSSETYQDVAHGGIETMPLSDHAPLAATLELSP